MCVCVCGGGGGQIVLFQAHHYLPTHPIHPSPGPPSTPCALYARRRKGPTSCSKRAGSPCVTPLRSSGPSSSSRAPQGAWMMEPRPPPLSPHLSRCSELLRRHRGSSEALWVALRRSALAVRGRLSDPARMCPLSLHQQVWSVGTPR